MNCLGVDESRRATTAKFIPKVSSRILQVMSLQEPPLHSGWFALAEQQPLNKTMKTDVG